MCQRILFISAGNRFTTQFNDLTTEILILVMILALITLVICRLGRELAFRNVVENLNLGLTDGAKVAPPGLAKTNEKLLWDCLAFTANSKAAPSAAHIERINAQRDTNCLNMWTDGIEQKIGANTGDTSAVEVTGMFV